MLRKVEVDDVPHVAVLLQCPQVGLDALLLVCQSTLAAFPRYVRHLQQAYVVLDIEVVKKCQAVANGCHVLLGLRLRDIQVCEAHNVAVLQAASMQVCLAQMRRNERQGKTK